jgi:hypothetical protein
MAIRPCATPAIEACTELESTLLTSAVVKIESHSRESANGVEYSTLGSSTRLAAEPAASPAVPPFSASRRLLPPLMRPDV